MSGLAPGNAARARGRMAIGGSSVATRSMARIIRLDGTGTRSSLRDRPALLPCHLDRSRVKYF